MNGMVKMECQSWCHYLYVCLELAYSDIHVILILALLMVYEISAYVLMLTCINLKPPWYAYVRTTVK